jgi:hypothetical protein
MNFSKHDAIFSETNAGIIDYSKLNAKGFDSDSFEMDVLNLSDPNSDLFENEEYNIQKEIEQLSLSVSKKAAERDHEF